MPFNRPFACCLLAAALPVAAQDGSAPADAAPTLARDLFTAAVDVRVVNVDVLVTDKKGRPVEGLTRDDFELYVDGRPAEIAYFYELAGDTPVAAPVDRVMIETGSEEPAVPLAPSSEVLIAIYLDNYWLQPGDRRRVLDDLERFVAAQPEGAFRFVVATHDPGIRILTPVTRDLVPVRQALATLPEAPASGHGSVLDRRRVFDQIRGIWETYFGAPTCPDTCTCAREQMIGAWEAYAQDLSHRVRVAGYGLEEFLAALSGVPDRKAVMYVGSGLEQRPGLDILQYLQDLCPHFEREFATFIHRYDVSDALLDMAAQANAARATLYTLDAGGLRADGTAGVDAFDARLRPSPLVGTIHRQNLQASLQILASATGGRSIQNANQPFDDLMRTAVDFEHGYALGYQPQGEPDDRRHRIRVELVEGKGRELRYRQSFVDKPLDKRLIDRAIAAMTFEVGDNPLGVTAALGAFERDGEVVRVPVEIDVDVGRLTRLPAGEGESTPVGRFRVFLAARAADGDRSLLRERFFEVTPAADEAGRQRITVTLPLEPGDYTIGVGIRDEIGTETSYLAVPASVPAAG